MSKLLARAVGRKAAGHAHRHGWLDFRFGLSLFRNERISAHTKVAAIAVGATATLAVLALELPLDTILAVVLPGIGLGLDIAFDGLELLILPFVFAGIALLHFAPKRTAGNR